MYDMESKRVFTVHDAVFFEDVLLHAHDTYLQQYLDSPDKFVPTRPTTSQTTVTVTMSTSPVSTTTPTAATNKDMHSDEYPTAISDQPAAQPTFSSTPQS